MALIKCPDCRNSISDSAERCPSCGCNFQPEYKRMLTLRQSIYNEEHSVKVRPTVTNDGMGSVVFTLLMLGVVVFGVFLLGSGGFDILLMALACIFIGGTLFVAGIASFLGDLERNKRSKNNVASFDRQQSERPERIARMRRELAQLEAKFR